MAPPGWYWDPLYGYQVSHQETYFLDGVEMQIHEDWPMRSVMKSWTSSLTLQMQGTLLAGVRGPDGVNRHHPTKVLVRAFRAVILHNAKPLSKENYFAGDGSGMVEFPQKQAFFDHLDETNTHWLTHFMLAAEVIGYAHPNRALAQFWLEIYRGICEYKHVTPETGEQMAQRLSADGVE